ncbi:MAG: DUF3160 domain-containing protein [Anaerolineaceae bacterium]|nr:DUF3160 domain-containing protein [Anaerolineaceae bacterium]
MQVKKWLLLFLIFLVAGCQMFVPSVTPTADNPSEEATPLPSASSTPGVLVTARPVSEPVDFTPLAWHKLTMMPLSVYDPGDVINPYSKLPVVLSSIQNREVISGLTVDQQVFLAQNGFIVIDSQEEQFKDIRYSVSKEQGQPYFLTTDAVYHALHVSFNDLLEALEKEALRPIMIKLLETVYLQVDGYYQFSLGNSLETDALLARNYLAVALKLFSPEHPLPNEVEGMIAAQLDQITAEAGKGESTLISGLLDDYTAYRPVGHYTSSPELQQYFRGMTWLGRVAFNLRDLGNQSSPSKAPLLITLALREAKLEGVPAYKVWLSIHEVLDFIIGPSDDPGPMELNELMEAVYGSDIYLELLQDEGKWQEYVLRVEELPAPQINSTFQDTSLEMEFERDWRFMGQRFTLDAFIFQQLITDKVTRRPFPKGLDLAAAYGSVEAEKSLELSGETRYPNYPEQLEKMKNFVNELPEEFWTERFYSAWQFAFRSQIEPKGPTYPAFMQSPAWIYKEINSMLASWAELKHDTILYAKMPEGLGGGGPPVSGPAPAYVEPNPNVYYRLAFATRTLNDGLRATLFDWQNRGWVQSEFTGQPGLQEYLNHMMQLGEKMKSFGEIAERELRGEPLTVNDYYRITACLEYKECVDPLGYMGDSMKPEAIPIIAAVSGFENQIMEVGVGYLNRIYVVIPVNAEVYVAQGGVLSYYEFIQPRQERLTDEAWREMLQKDPPNRPAWTVNFMVPGGRAVDVLAFRMGDVFVVTEEGGNPPLNLRAEPTRTAKVASILEPDTYFEIIEGPELVAKETWWKVRIFNEDTEGWILENQTWYRRSY